MTRLSLFRSVLVVGVGACSYLLGGCATNSLRTPNGAPASRSAPFEYSMDENHPLPASGVIRLTSEDAQVSIAGSDREDVRIQVHYRISAAPEKLTRFTYRVQVADADGELVVTEERRTGSRNFVYDQQVHAITIEVPRHALVTVNEEDGACAISGIAGRVHLTMDDGRARLENCSGDITISMDGGTVVQTNCAKLRYARR